MNHEEVDQTVARKSAFLYLPLSVGAALLFVLLASLAGEFSLVARIGGAVWVGLLTLITAMPIVTSQVKHRVRG